MPLEAFRGRAVQIKSQVISNRPLQEAYLIDLIMHQCDGENSTKTGTNSWLLQTERYN